ncbi:MAG: DUF751 family protein, partial [Chitinophagia bacterium]|nr:DUF751 family protein [Chitinophagia bacterium]
LLIKKPKIISLLSSSVLVWFGGISYEFYLIHESLGISLLSKMGQLNVFPNNVLLQIIVISLILSILIFFSLILKKMTKDSKQLIQYIVKIRSHL